MLKNQYCKAAFSKLTPQKRIIALGNMLTEELISQGIAIGNSTIPISISVHSFYDIPDDLDVVLCKEHSVTRITGKSSQTVHDFVETAMIKRNAEKVAKEGVTEEGNNG